MEGIRSGYCEGNEIKCKTRGNRVCAMKDEKKRIQSNGVVDGKATRNF